MQGVSIAIIGILIIAISTMFVASAFGEEHTFVNTIPVYLEIEQGDSIKLINLSNSTINITHDEICCTHMNSSIEVNGTWAGKFPYEPGMYGWITDNHYGQILIKEPHTSVVSVEDNIITGNVEPNTPTVVTTISPSHETTNTVVTPDSNGDFETKLNPTEKGSHIIYVTQDGDTVKTTYNVEDENKNLEIRLSLLQTLQAILEIIFGK